MYRSFDRRFILYIPSKLARARESLACNFLSQNLGLILIRRTREDSSANFFVTDDLTDKSVISSADNANIFPLYIYPNTQNEQGSLFVERTPNLSSNFLSTIREKLGYVPTPEAIFYYIYAIFYNPTYRQRYAEFLKIDFPHVLLTSNDDIFEALSEKGQKLVDLHLMKSQKLSKLITKIGGSEDDNFTEVTYKPKEKRVYINKERYFEGIDIDVWEFKIGGYQVLDKWLKDRNKANRTLLFDDLLHYQKIVVALQETMQLMAEIDRLIPGFPIE